MRLIVKMHSKLTAIFLLSLFSCAVLALDISEVQRGDNVILIKPMEDGVTYLVQTPYGREIWKDRDLYYFAAFEEKCTVVESNGSEVLLSVPIMNTQYWFTVEQTKADRK